jgi:hypothetical protein
MPLDEVVIFDADENTVELPVVFNDLKSMPEDVVRTLKHVLKKHTSGVDDIISKAFVLAFAAMIGDYRDSFKRKDGKIRFDKDAFLENHPQQFFQQLMQFQHFQQFVSERLDVLNQGKGINDVFEQVVAECKQEVSRSNISAKNMAMRAARKAIPGMKNLMLQARRKAKTGMKVLKRARAPKGDDMGKDRTNSDSDTELDRKQGNGFARGVPFENPPETVGASHPAMRQRRTPPAIPAPYAVYKELKSRQSQRPRSNDISKVSSSSGIDGVPRHSEPTKSKTEPLISFSPESSPKVTPKRHNSFNVSEVEDLLGLSLSNPSAQAQVLPTAMTLNPHRGSAASWEEGFERDITGSFTNDLINQFDTHLTRKIIESSESSDDLVSTASSSGDERDPGEPPPIPPRPFTSPLQTFSETNPFDTATDSLFQGQEQLSTHPTTTTSPYSQLEAKARESRLQSLNSLFSTAFDSESIRFGDISWESSVSKVDHPQQEFGLCSQQDIDLFDPLKKSQ